MDGWYMDSDFCCECGCLLDYFESVMCGDCWENAWYGEEQERYAAFELDEEEDQNYANHEVSGQS